MQTGWHSGRRGDVPSDLVRDYDDYFYDASYDESPFDYDSPADLDGYPDDYGFDYELCHDLHGPDDCGVYWAARGETGGSTYWSDDVARDVCMRGVALPQPGPQELLDSAIHTPGPVEPVYDVVAEQHVPSG